MQALAYEYGKAEDTRCDFCSNKNIMYRYPAKNFPMEDGAVSGGDWYACPHCYTLIKENRYDLLTAWSVEKFLTHGMGPLPGLERRKMEKKIKPRIEHLHQQFREHRDGEPELLEELDDE